MGQRDVLLQRQSLAWDHGKIKPNLINTIHILKCVLIPQYHSSTHKLNEIEVQKLRIAQRGTSLAFQWLRFHASTAGAQVPSLVGEPRSRMLRSAAKKKKRITETESKRSKQNERPTLLVGL